MMKNFSFWVYRLNISAKINRAYDAEYDEHYNATDGSGNCFFDDALTIWRQNDDWYCSIRSNDPSDAKINEYLQDAYNTIYDAVDASAEDRIISPVLLFHNAEVC